MNKTEERDIIVRITVPNNDATNSYMPRLYTRNLHGHTNEIYN